MMKVRDLMKFISGEDLDLEFLVSSDEELNTLYEKWEVSEIELDKRDKNGSKQKALVIFGYSGTEVN